MAGSKMKKIRRAIRYYLLKFLRLKGAPWKVAVGFALGACINFYPTFGIGILCAGLLAGVFRVSISASLLGDILFKSLFPAFFYFNLVMGNFLLGKDLNHLRRSLIVLSHLNKSNLELISEVFFLGAFVNTLILGVLLYSIIYLMFSRYRGNLLRFVYHLKK
ncbi:MAG TPA: DUF2062 domain-containing protein [Candidatus Deferrimicrobium sp.]|nr:DUF2062 domain-containing protein [Candidatus Deferrimicrobium sp.]